MDTALDYAYAGPRTPRASIDDSSEPPSLSNSITSTPRTPAAESKILPAAPAAAAPTSAPDSSPSPKRFSALFSSARAGLDTLVRKSATFFLDEGDDDSALVIEWRWETLAAADQRARDRTTAARGSKSGHAAVSDGPEDNALRDKDGWVEGWLD